MAHDEVPAGWYEEGAQERYWDGSDWTGRYRPIDGTGGGPKLVDSGRSDDAHVEYKVLTQKDRFFGGKFDPLKLEEHAPGELLNPFRWDTESWYGEGQALRVPPEP